MSDTKVEEKYSTTQVFKHGRPVGVWKVLARAGTAGITIYAGDTRDHGVMFAELSDRELRTVTDGLFITGRTLASMLNSRSEIILCLAVTPEGLSIIVPQFERAVTIPLEAQTLTADARYAHLAADYAAYRASMDRAIAGYRSQLEKKITSSSRPSDGTPRDVSTGQTSPASLT